MDEFEQQSRAGEWTPPHGAERHGRNRVARKRLRVSLRRIVDAVLGKDSWFERIREERRQQRGDE